MSTINLLVEGPLDEAVATRLVVHAGHTTGTCYGRCGSGFIRANIHRYNTAARFSPYLALVDFMDTGLPCPPEVIRRWLPNPQPLFRFRVVVNEIESWILADRDGIAAFLGVQRNRVPTNPETLNNPKQELVNIARRSRLRRVLANLVPEDGSTAQVGMLYTSELTRFISDCWDISRASTNAPSLRRCILGLQSIQ